MMARPEDGTDKENKRKKGNAQGKNCARRRKTGVRGAALGIILAALTFFLPGGTGSQGQTAVSQAALQTGGYSGHQEYQTKAGGNSLPDALPAGGSSQKAPQSGEDAELTLYAQSAVLMDAGTGRILYEKNGDVRRPMASTTKIMTCILALEEGNPDDLVEVSAYAASMPDVQLGIREGETYYLKDLLYSLMLESHNDTAVAVAEHIGGTVEGFAERMNQKARDIGCADTCFVTPNGLDGKREDGTPHSTTARDLARIMCYCINTSPRRKEFIELTRAASHSFTDTEKKRSFYCANHNAFLTMMPEALTGKTGFTGEAGYCYIGAVRDGDRTFAVALLGCGWPPHKTYKWSDMKKLASYGLSEYGYRELFERGKTFPDILVRDGVKKEAGIELAVPEEEQTLCVLARDGEHAEVRYRYPKEMEAPVREGDAVGSADYYLDGELLRSYPICAAETVDRIDFLYCLEKCLEGILM